MKKQLLTALVALTPFFAIANQQPTHNALLTHLQHVRTEINNATQQMQDSWLDEVDETIDKNERINRNFGLQVINEFYDNSVLLQQLIDRHINEDFNFLCTNLINIDQLPNKQIYIEPTITEEEKKQLYQEFEPIFTKHHQEYCTSYPHGELIAITAGDTFEEILEITFAIKEPHAWLQKVDAKIASLEQQV